LFHDPRGRAEFGGAKRQRAVVKSRHTYFLGIVAGAWLVLLIGPSVAADFSERISPGLFQLSQNVPTESQQTVIRGARSAAPAYRVDTGDRISITVYQEPDLSITGVRVKSDGTIAYPLLGDLRVGGLTSQDVQDLVTSKLQDGYLKKPSISVSIDSYRLYYIKGEVSRPGGYTFVDGLTVAKAVALAGGYGARASEGRITLVRESDPENPQKSVETNTAIEPGDIITVGESFF
jgi:protein involved in polysaccharide export with SLBB domain